MSEESTPVTVAGKGTVSFSRKVQVRDYEAAEAFMSVQFDFDPSAPIEADNSILTRAKAAFYDAKAVVFEELGIDFDVVNGVVVEKLIERYFGAVTEVAPAAPASKPRAESEPSEDHPECPECHGQMWDNRPKKASGAFSKRAPDFKCRDKSCSGVIWPPKGGRS